MSVTEALKVVLDTLPEVRLREVLAFAQSLTHQEEEQEWRDFGRAQFARAYALDEPEYTLADLKPDRNS